MLLLVAALLLASCGQAANPGTDTTTAPDGTTAAPVETTAPDGTTAAPGETTAAPGETTATLATTATPETTAAPVTTEESAVHPEEILFDVPRTTNISASFSSDIVKASAMDKKYVVKTEGGYTYIDIEAPQLAISGFPFAETNTLKYYRLDYSLYDKYPSNGSSDSVQRLSHHSAGGRVRFKTDADSIMVNVTLKMPARMTHMPDTGSCGCDVYVGSGANPVWVGVVDPGTSGSSYNVKVDLPAGTKQVMIVLPLYAGIEKMSIGVPDGKSVSSPDPYLIEDPVVYYGSSITQGACASRPGMSYTDITTRMLGANLVNIGFSSSAKGETIVGETIARIKMSAFVYDYDHNGDVDNLRATHYNFYKIIRNAQPDVPIIMISRFSQGYSTTEAGAAERRAIIKATYDKAIAEGDKNVYFIDGADVYPAEYRGSCLVDGTHPNDLGMYFVANAIYPVLKEALTKAGYIK